MTSENPLSRCAATQKYPEKLDVGTGKKWKRVRKMGRSHQEPIAWFLGTCEKREGEFGLKMNTELEIGLAISSEEERSHIEEK